MIDLALAVAAAVGAATVPQDAKSGWIGCTNRRLSDLMEREREHESWTKPKALVNQALAACEAEFDTMRSQLSRGELKKVSQSWRRTLLRSADADFKFRVVAVF